MPVPPFVAPLPPPPGAGASAAGASAAGASATGAFATAPDRRSRAITHLVVPAGLALGVGIWDPARHGGPPLCPYAAITGHACPGCGLTRALGALLRGRWHEAVTWHPLAPVLAVQAVAFCLAYVLLGEGLRRRAPSWLLPAALVVNTVLLVGVWIVRGITGDLAGLA